jgi:hypothetical protein
VELTALFKYLIIKKYIFIFSNRNLKTSSLVTLIFQCQSQSYFTTGGLPPISSPWQQAPSDSRPAFFLIEQLRL